MALYEQRLEMRGMRRSEIESYFIDINAVDSGCGVYKSSYWMVEVGEEVFLALGSLKIPSTTVVFNSSEKEILESAVGAFRLRFLSAGG